MIVSLLQSKTRADGWVDALITVSASGVCGSEGRATYLIAPVPVDAASLAQLACDPAYRFSPYGKASICSDRN